MPCLHAVNQTKHSKYTNTQQKLLLYTGGHLKWHVRRCKPILKACMPCTSSQIGLEFTWGRLGACVNIGQHKYQLLSSLESRLLSRAVCMPLDADIIKQGWTLVLYMSLCKLQQHVYIVMLNRMLCNCYRDEMCSCFMHNTWGYNLEYYEVTCTCLESPQQLNFLVEWQFHELRNRPFVLALLSWEQSWYES